MDTTPPLLIERGGKRDTKRPICARIPNNRWSKFHGNNYGMRNCTRHAQQTASIIAKAGSSQNIEVSKTNTQFRI